MFKSGVFYDKPKSSLGQRRPEGLLGNEYPDVYVSYKSRGNGNFKFDVLKPLQTMGLTVYVDYLSPTSDMNSPDIADNINSIIDKVGAVLFVLDDENDERWYTPFAYGLASTRRLYLGTHVLKVQRNINFLPGYLRTNGFVSETPMELYDWANILASFRKRDKDIAYSTTFEEDILNAFKEAVKSIRKEG